MTKSLDLRELVLNILIDITENETYSHLALNQTLRNYQYLEKQDRAFISRLTEGTMENLLLLDYVINQFSTVKVKKMKPVIRNVIRMGVYQILFMDSVPDSAACNEAVKLSGKRGFKNLKGFVNGVLRNISRNKDGIKYPSEEKNPIDYLSVMYSTPVWIVEKWLNEFDYNTVKGILEASMNEKDTTIRCNLEKTTLEDLKNELEEQNISVLPGDYLSYALKISNYNYLYDIPAFVEGKFQIQDESSMLVGQVSGVEMDDNVLDVCAAPGGKTLHIAQLLNGTGNIEARDVSEYKVSLINENVKRLGLHNVTARVHDALQMDESKIGKIDILLADLPCSGLGVLGKKNDIKYKMTKEKQEELILLQRNMLDVVASYVKPKGTLIYSTCTINEGENYGNVKWFLDHHDFVLESLDDYLPKKLQNETSKKGYLQLVPGCYTTDGFFIARLRKK